MHRAFAVFPTLASFLAVALLLLLRSVGLLSHQVLGLLLLGGVGVAVASRAWWWWRGTLDSGFVRDPLHPDRCGIRIRVVGRGAFWAVVSGAALLVFPRSADLIGLIAVVAVLGLLRVAAELLPPHGPRHGTTAALALATAVLLWDVAWVVIPEPRGAIVLAAPFAGDWQVLQGGQSRLVSHHLAASNQRFALDWMRLVDGRLFGEAQGNAQWPSWEQPLFAPVAGTVVVARDDLPDNDGPHFVVDPADAAGNSVVIETASGHFVLFAHMRHETVAVRVGDEVTVGQPLGKVGNSGNTTGPHLHLQVQTHADLWDPVNRSVPFTFTEGGRALSRNARLSGRPEGP